uniref:Leucine-rich repeat-containing protein 51 n=1 Tax=Felis catus TaxID=9685 RepID=A0ABI8A9K3_FELCA
MAPVGWSFTQGHASGPGKRKCEDHWEERSGVTTSGSRPRLESKENHKSQHLPRPRRPAPRPTTTPDLTSEEPRTGLRPLRHSKSGKSLTQSLWLNNNVLNDLKDFSHVVSLLLEHPENLAWIDLSFNDLSSIDPVLTTFFNLSVLYLHGNSIQRLGEVNKLAVLPRLRSLTLHGNPIEEEKGYRQYVLCTLPRITTFDFSGVTKADRTTAEVWKRMNIKPKKFRIKQNAL